MVKPSSDGEYSFTDPEGLSPATNHGLSPLKRTNHTYTGDIADGGCHPDPITELFCGDGMHLTFSISSNVWPIHNRHGPNTTKGDPTSIAINGNRIGNPKSKAMGNLSGGGEEMPSTEEGAPDTHVTRRVIFLDPLRGGAPPNRLA